MAARWLLLIAAYTYLIKRLVCFEDYAAIANLLRQAQWHQFLCIVLCVMLMPVNLLLEALRWRTALAKITQITLRQSFTQVIGGMLGAFLTPFRAGEIPARLLYLKERQDWKKALAAGVFASILMTAVIIICGWIPTTVYLHEISTPGVQAEIAATAVALCLGTGVLLYLNHRKQWFAVPSASWQGYSRLAMLTLLRYLCFALQFFLMLRAVGITLSPVEALVAIPTYYLLVTLTPNMPAADAGIRGSWAIFVFSHYTDAVPMIALAAVGIWLINTILPLLAAPVQSRRLLQSR